MRRKMWPFVRRVLGGFSGLVLALALGAGPDRVLGAATSASPASSSDEAAALLAVFEAEENITNTLGAVMVWLPAGYRVGRYEVTQAEFEAVMGKNPSRFKGNRHPVERVSWADANAFCQRLTAKELEAGKLPEGYRYRLPKEGEWEHYVGEARLEDAITSHLGDRRTTEAVGGLGANKFGLYDVRGNVWEWCASGAARGGSWRSFEDYLAVSFRFVGTASTEYDDIGFRCVLEGPPATRNPKADPGQR